MKERLTAEQIAERCDHLDGQANIAAINRLYRAQDGSTRQGYDLVESAIRRVRKDRADGCFISPGLEYAYALEEKLGELCNADY